MSAADSVFLGVGLSPRENVSIATVSPVENCSPDSSGGAVICSFPLIPAGASFPVTVTALVGSAGPLFFDASLSSPVSDPDLGNNFATASVEAFRQ